MLLLDVVLYLSFANPCVQQIDLYFNHMLVMKETLELEGSVRSVTRRLITIANPLDTEAPITFPNVTGGSSEGMKHEGWWRCTSPHVRLMRIGEMAGNLEGVFAVDYRPLVASTEDVQGKQEEAELSFDIEELGTYR